MALSRGIRDPPPRRPPRPVAARAQRATYRVTRATTAFLTLSRMHGSTVVIEASNRPLSIDRRSTIPSQMSVGFPLDVSGSSHSFVRARIWGAVGVGSCCRGDVAGSVGAVIEVEDFRTPAHPQFSSRTTASPRVPKSFRGGSPSADVCSCILAAGGYGKVGGFVHVDSPMRISDGSGGSRWWGCSAGSGGENQRCAIAVGMIAESTTTVTSSENWVRLMMCAFRP